MSGPVSPPWAAEPDRRPCRVDRSYRRVSAATSSPAFPSIVGPTLRMVAEEGESLIPAESLRIYRARGLESEGELDSAVAVLSRVIARPQIAGNISRAASVLGRWASERGDFRQAVAWYERSATAGSPFPAGAQSWVFFAIQTGDQESLRRAGQALVDAQEATDRAFCQYLTRVRASRLSGLWHPTPKSQELTKSMKGDHEQIEKILGLFL